jgi:hypothetical protein
MLIHNRDSQQCASKLKRTMWHINWCLCEENHTKKIQKNSSQLQEKL